MFCRRCGAKLQSEENFCGSCGSAATTLSREAPPASEPIPVKIIEENRTLWEDLRDSPKLVLFLVWTLSFAGLLFATMKLVTGDIKVRIPNFFGAAFFTCMIIAGLITYWVRTIQRK